jgi:hypothetical protein
MQKFDFLFYSKCRIANDPSRCLMNYVFLYPSREKNPPDGATARDAGDGNKMDIGWMCMI